MTLFIFIFKMVSSRVHGLFMCLERYVYICEGKCFLERRLLHEGYGDGDK